jgi:glutamate 5-kinase
MKTSLRYREDMRHVRRIVVKIGTRVLVQKSGRPESRRMRSLVKELASLRKRGYEVVVVTSGAIGAGMEALGMKGRPTKLPDLQMAAAVGQCRLMAQYDKLFGTERCRVAQILLTRDNFRHKIRMTNARRTVENLLRNGVIPIINENDAVADDEIRADLALGDNDLLSAMVAKLVRADLLIMLTTVNGVQRPGKSGRSERVKYLESITRKTYSLVSDRSEGLSRGGMTSKLKAAQTVSGAGAGSVIADGRTPGILAKIVGGKDVGTFIVASL